MSENTKRHKRDLAKEDAGGVAKCISACEGVDDVLLELLVRKDSDDKTSLQHILDRIDWSGAHRTIE